MKRVDRRQASSWLGRTASGGTAGVAGSVSWTRIAAGAHRLQMGRREMISSSGAIRWAPAPSMGTGELGRHRGMGVVTVGAYSQCLSMRP